MDSLIYYATNLIASLILPPGVFVVLIGAGLYWGRGRRWGFWFAGLSLALMFALSLKVVAFALWAPFEEHTRPLSSAAINALKGTQAVIVALGGGRALGAIEYERAETLSGPSLRRTVYAAWLAERTGLPLAVVGGRPAGGALSEGELMKELLENRMGRKVDLTEDASFDTRQNARNTAKLLADRKIGTVVLVTDVLHMPRAARAFEVAGLKVIPAPMNFRASKPMDVTDFFPSTEALEASSYVLHEYVGMAWYWMREWFL